MNDTREDYRTYFRIGLVLSVLMIAGLAFYSFSERTRLANAAESFTQERVARGEQIYTAQCVACHGSNGEGGTGPALNSRQLLKSTQDSVFFSIIRSGVPNTQMPAWSVDYGGPLTDEDVRDVVAFMRAWEPSAPEIEEAVYVPDPQHGALLFTNTCEACHGANGSGADQAPKINDQQRLSSLPDEWYREVIRNGRPAKGMPTWGTVLSPEQIEDLVALIAAWRDGIDIQPDFSITDLLDRAIFFLENDEDQSAALQIDRALSLTEGAGAELLVTAKDQLSERDMSAALDTLRSLRDLWPLGDPAAGATAYTENCSTCHGIQGEGGIGLPLNPSEFIQSQNNAQIFEVISTGRPGTAMLAFADRLSETDIADIIAFLKLWQQ